MLRVLDADAKCGRRELLSIGSLAVGGLSLPTLLAAKTGRASESRTAELLTGKSVIFLFQQGGPSQFETFDPKPEAPSDIRTITGTIPTTLPGVFFGDTFSQLAPLADRLAVVRSFQTGNANHNIRPIVGPESRNATLGALYSRVAGTTHPVTAMPTSAVLFPQSVCEDVTKGDGRGDLLATGPFGGTYAPFIPGGANQLLQNLRLNLSADRLQDRRALQSQLDLLSRQFEAESQFDAVDRQQRQACEVLLSGAVAEALDLTRESPEIVAQYDTSRYASADDWRTPSAASGAITRGMPSRWGNRCFWPAGCARPAAGSSRSTAAMKACGTCTPTATISTWETACRPWAARSITQWRRSSATWKPAVCRTGFC